MSNKSTATLVHPAFSDTIVELEGADTIKAYKEAGWLEATSKQVAAAAQATTEPTPLPAEAPTVDAPAIKPSK